MMLDTAKTMYGRSAGSLAILSLVFCFSTQGAEDKRPDWVLPVETQEVSADWQAPEDSPPIRRIVDEATGKWCIEYYEQSPLKKRVFYTEFDRSLMDGHDALRFRWKSMADNAWVQAQVSGYPEPGREKRNYYLVKRPPAKGQWQEVWLDLNLDDDLGAGAADASEGKVRVALTVNLWDMGEVGDPPRVRVRFANIRFEKHPIQLEKEVAAVSNIEESERIGQRHPITVHNRSSRMQNVILGVDSKELTEFQVTMSEKRFALAPGASRRVTADITVSPNRARALPALYSEQASVFAAVTDYPEHVTTTFQGYLLQRLTGAVPPAKGPYPRFKTAEARERTLAARPQATAGGKAEAMLDISVEPPELRHGYSGSYMDPGPPQRPLRFRGPGKHYSERTGGLIDIATMPEKVQKAGAFAHHSYLSKAAYTLADAWWRTGRKEFARKAADILLAYAERYPSYSPANPYATGYASRIGHAVLGECWWFGRMPEAFDLVMASGVLDEKESQAIIDGLMIPAMVTISTHRVAANQQAETNASYGKAALVAERWDYAAKALDGEYGMRAQWEIDFDADGFTMEREMPYHFAALHPFVDFANCLEAVGVDVYDMNFKRLFDAPLAYDIRGRPGNGGLYVHAYRHYHDPDYLPLVADKLDPDELPEKQIEQEYSNSTLAAGGYTVLRAGTEAEGLRAITMNWGCPSHRGGNVLLNPLFYWKKHRLNEHVFRIGYGYEQSHFSYTAAAGNAVLKDGKRHSMLRAAPVALLEGDMPAGRWTSPLDRPQYAGVEWSRTVAICGDSMVLLDQVESAEPARWDWLTYFPAELTAVNPSAEWEAYKPLLEQGDGYRYFQESEKAGGLSPVAGIGIQYRLRKQDKLTGYLTLLSSASTLFRAEGYVSWHPRLVPVLIQRAENTSSFWSAAAYTGGESDVEEHTSMKALEVYRDGQRLAAPQAIAIRITNPAGTFVVLTSKYDGPHRVGEQTLEGPLNTLKLE
ncbi:MAG: alginate lyase family protein [Candidatus Pacebacteria bacterium]|nr:alginate lyase family protein [Candidatus Paceibacterota bacterium]